MAPLQVTHHSDPCCPWAYSASPAIAALRWRYGDQLDWRLVLIGLAEHSSVYAELGFTGERMATGYASFRDRYRMPFATAPRERPPATAPACRAVVATRLQAPGLAWRAFRALQFAQFTTSLQIDEPDGLRAALARVAGLDVDAVIDALDSDAVTAAYEADRAEARTAEGGPTEFQGKAAQSDGTVRYTAPSLIFETADGRHLEAGGFQPVEAYDVCIANLDPTLERREPPEDVAELLAALPEGLTTQEVAQALASGNDAPDRAAAELRLIEAAARGTAQREPLGSDALWTAA